ncbi:hypothetical protein FRC12_021055 [Ceratobasidium sp. 428]|nr:hypothetical protein FRC12_021055 [Ceratobasidium sp. 428]
MPAPTIFSSSTDDWVRPTTSLGSAAPINGGGPSCAQDCLARAASGAGCSSSVDMQCVCSSPTFRGLAQNCFGMSNCDASSASRALNDVNTLCQAGQAPPPGPSPTFSAPAPAPTVAPPSPGPSSANPAPNTETTNRQAAQTSVLSSGAILTISGMRTTLTAGITTVLTQPTGTGVTKPAESGSPDGNASNSVSRVRELGGWMMALGCLGGLAILL